MRIIGLTGKARSGKNTVASIIEDEFIAKMYTLPDIHVVAFGDALKEACSLMFGIPLERFNSDDAKEAKDNFWGFSPREICQYIGTEVAREHFDPEFWIKRLQLELQREYDVRNDVFVIADVRFDNEAQWIRNNGGIVIRVVRPEANGDVGIPSHVSEAGVSENLIDYTIFNNGTLDQLQTKTEEVANRLFRAFGLDEEEETLNNKQLTMPLS